MCFTIWSANEGLSDQWIFENNNTTTISVNKTHQAFDWMRIKFGKLMTPVQVAMMMMQKDESNVAKFKVESEKHFEYRYIRKAPNGIIQERDP